MAIIELTPKQIANKDYLTLAESGHFFMGSFGTEYPRAYHCGSRIFIVSSISDQFTDTEKWSLIKELQKKDKEEYDAIYGLSLSY